MDGADQLGDIAARQETPGRDRVRETGRVGPRHSVLALVEEDRHAPEDAVLFLFACTHATHHKIASSGNARQNTVQTIQSQAVKCPNAASS